MRLGPQKQGQGQNQDQDRLYKSASDYVSYKFYGVSKATGWLVAWRSR